MTYSIVARDPATGAIGVAVESHYFGVGRVVTWAESGVGAVATQSVPETAYGPRGIELMRCGSSARSALETLVGSDPQRFVRQVAMIDAGGEVAVHTGELCLAEAGHATGHQVSVQANLMEKPTVWGAMLCAFEARAGDDLPLRLLAALDAAEAEGGDLRGKQSAAMLVVSGTRSDAPWDQRIVDLRVDDHPDPLGELRRLLELNRAFDRLARLFVGGLLFGPIAADAPELERSLSELDATQRALGANREPTFWQAVLLAKAGRLEEARRKLALACDTNPRWRLLVARLAPCGILPAGHPWLEKGNPEA
jgi:uncharacterized Ntn-hydrolase superfamily protein